MQQKVSTKPTAQVGNTQHATDLALDSFVLSKRSFMDPAINGDAENGVASSPTVDLQHQAQTQVPLLVESAGPVAEPSDERSHGVSGTAPSPLATASWEQPQQSLREAERPQEVQPQQTGRSSSSQGSQGKATAEEIVHIDVGDGGAVPDAAASMSQEARQEYEMRNTPAHIFLGMPQDNVRTKQLEDLRSSQFEKYRRFAQRWLQRKREKQLQQQPQLQQLNANLLQPQLQGGTNLQHAQFQQPQPQPLVGLQHTPLQVGQPLQGGMLAIAQRQAQAFSLAQGVQLSPGAAPIAGQPSAPLAGVSGEAIDLTDDTAAPVAQPPAPAPSQPEPMLPNVLPYNDAARDWRAYQAFKHSQEQFRQQQYHQVLQQQQHQQHEGMQMHLQHTQTIQNGYQNGYQNGASAGGGGSGVPYWPHQQPLLPLSQQQQGHGLYVPNLDTGHRTLPDYSIGQAGAKRPRYEERQRYEPREEHAGTVTFSLISTSFFTAKIRRPTPAKVHTYFKLTEGATYDEKERRWKFPLGMHEDLSGLLSREGIQVVPVPRQALAAASLAIGPEQDAEGEEGEAGKSDNEAPAKLCETMARRVPECIRKNLAPFQIQGVEFVLKKEGRAMIADEMGLGKTIQAIACAAAYESEWPLLIICPSSARYHWEHELLKWLDEESVTKKQIMVVCKSKQDLNRGVTKVVIMSYELVNRMKEVLDQFRFGVVICDECHYLKNQRAARTKAIVPIATKARRAILLSGTPALSRPSELFTQLNLLSASTWASFREFGKRYCAGKKGKGKKGKFGVDYSGASHIAELHALLRATVMVRRLKKNILKNLPPKQRTLVDVRVEDDGARQALHDDLSLLATRDALLGRLTKEHSDKPQGQQSSEMQSSVSSQSTQAAHDPEVFAYSRTPKNAPTELKKGKGNARQHKVPPGKGRVTKLSALPPAAVAKDASHTSTNGSINGEAPASTGDSTSGSGRSLADMSRRELAQERRSLLMRLFADTGTAKIPGVIRHVFDILSDKMTGGKLLVFAHHRNVLDALEQGVLRSGHIEYIRIDGRTKPKDRQDLVDKFQSNPSVRVALLGLTAAGIGITLTAASRVVFAELYWTPAQLLQAEDRCHRIGQSTVVKVQYLVAKGSLDDALWPLIQQKIKLLGEMVEGEGEPSQMEVESPRTKDTGPSAATPAGASTVTADKTDKSTEKAPRGDISGRDSTAKPTENARPGDTSGQNSTAEDERAAFQRLQASVAENAQELAVEDMRHELDDEGRREFFEEQEEDVEGGSRGGNESGGYSSGYSDGGGGQGAADDVYDIVDSDDEQYDVDIEAGSTPQEYGSAQARAISGTQVPMLPNPTEYARSWDAGGDAVEPLGLEAATAAAKASAGAQEPTLRKTSPGAVGTSAASSTMVPQVSPVEEVIDLLSGDEEDASDSGVGGKSLRENGEVSHSARSTGTSCNEVVVLDDDTVGEACLVASTHKGLESSEAKPLSSGPDKLQDANALLDVSFPPVSTDRREKLGDDLLKDANASLEVSVPPKSIDGGETATQPVDDLTGCGDGGEIATEPALASKTGL